MVQIITKSTDAEMDLVKKKQKEERERETRILFQDLQRGEEKKT